jgi:hypothetical protein
MPEPALIRSVLVTVSGVVAFLLGREIDLTWIDFAVTVYGLAAPLLAGILVRSAVSSNASRNG